MDLNSSGPCGKTFDIAHTRAYKHNISMCPFAACKRCKLHEQPGVKSVAHGARILEKKYKATHLDKASFGKDSPYNEAAGKAWLEETKEKLKKLVAAQRNELQYLSPHCLLILSLCFWTAFPFSVL
eukprot:SAG11_NODE_5683_length_1487_cov_9.733429_2_plen_126_part_00